MSEEFDELEEIVTGSGDLEEIEALIDNGDFEDLDGPPPEDIHAPRIMGELVPPAEAVANYNETAEGFELMQMWGSAAEENIEIAQREGAQIISDLERHDPQAAAVLLDAVLKMSPSQETAVLAALAKRGRSQ